MKFKSLIAFSAIALSFSAYAQSGSNNAASGSAAQPSGSANDAGMNQGDQSRAPSSSSATTNSQDQGSNAASDMSPKQICQKIVDTEKQPNADVSQLNQYVLSHNAQRMDQKLRQGWVKNEIGQADCKDEKIAGTHAFVVTTANGQDRLLPFVKQGNQWKLDLMGYRMLYRMDRRMPASQSQSQSQNK
jgi:hypothetical protein